MSFSAYLDTQADESSQFKIKFNISDNHKKVQLLTDSFPFVNTASHLMFFL